MLMLSGLALSHHRRLATALPSMFQGDVGQAPGKSGQFELQQSSD
jgi:hypothetical protein